MEKLKLIKNCILLFICFFVISSCGLDQYTVNVPPPPPVDRKTVDVNNPYLPKAAVIPASNIKSIQLKSSFSNLPIIYLDSLGNNKGTLELSFDLLKEDRNLAVEFSAYKPDWSKSDFPINFYMNFSGLFYMKSRNSNNLLGPLYQRYSVKFPTTDMKFTHSGNFMMEVFDVETNQILLSLPFFVSEEYGHSVLDIETLYNQGRDARLVAQPFSKYYPTKDMMNPFMNTEVYFAQNKRYGLTKKANQSDMNNAQYNRYYISRDESFIADEEIINLDLTNPSISQYRFRNIVVKDSVKSLELVTDDLGINEFRATKNYSDVSYNNDPRSEYMMVQFEAKIPYQYEKYDVYLAGNFNNWAIDGNLKAELSELNGAIYAHVNTLLKKGYYQYKYIFVDKSGTIHNSISVNAYQDFGNIYQQFVYYNDPQSMMYRLVSTSSKKVSF